MDDSNHLGLSSFEQQLLNDSFGTGKNVRRIRGIVLSGGIGVAGLALFPLFGFGFQLLATLFVLTLVFSIFEKLSYTRAMSNYDSLIRKLVHRVEKLEGLPLTGRDGRSDLTERGSPDQQVAW
jgi:hypothetical protein